MIDIVEHKISIEKYFDVSDTKETGGVVFFVGTVRNVNQGKQVDYLEYESMIPLAKGVIQSICNKASEKWNLHKITVLHRIGRLDIGDVAVLVVTHSMHRKEAYEANQYVIDHLKHEAPIWKKEVYIDGSFEWGNNCNCAKHLGTHEHHLSS